MRAFIDFLLHDWLKVDALPARPRHDGQDRNLYAQVLDAAERLAAERFAPFNRLVDTEEPHFDGERVVLPQAAHDAWTAYAASGLLAATHDADWGGAQLPHAVATAAQAFFAKASVSIHAGMLTVGNANLLLAHGTPAQCEAFARRELSGEWAGTMALSEPQAGSSLSDIVTRAVPDGSGAADDSLGPRYRLHGSKMWISAGEHDLTDNIVHLVLAKIPQPDGSLPAGTHGISLFVCPKWLVDADGRPTGERNDIALAGLNHKLGWRGTPNTLLNFGEGRWTPRGAPGAIAWRVGGAGRGLACMFHMMNEARIAIGLSAAMLGRAGFEVARDYAAERRQGRPVQQASSRGAVKDVQAEPVPIIEHADVRRMLLAQKAYADGAAALVLYCARLVDEERTGTPDAAARATQLLQLLTPIAKSWPSEWCLEGNSLAIQVLGGAGYTRDFPVEQYWRDQRLNMIHEGTHGIQAMDLLGRKVVMDGGASLAVLLETMRSTTERARAAAAAGGWPELAAHADAIDGAGRQVETATRNAWASGDAAAALANATPYLRGVGHVVWCWTWLDVAVAASTAAGASAAVATGVRQACRYAFAHELPHATVWLDLVARGDRTALETDPDVLR